MSSEGRGITVERSPDVNTLFDALAAAERRELLAHLRHDRAASVDALASALTADTDRVRTHLHHTHLPKLADAGLVQRDGSKISLADPSAMNSAVVRDVLDAHPDASLDAVCDALADRLRRAALSLLRSADRTLSVGVLASSLPTVAEGMVGGPTEPGVDRRIAVGMHHRDLPKLADAGLVAYDAEAETVTYRGSRLVDEWLDRGALDVPDDATVG